MISRKWPASIAATLALILYAYSEIGALTTKVVGGDGSTWAAQGVQLLAVDVSTQPGRLRPDSLSTVDNLAPDTEQRGGEIASPQGVMRLQEGKQYEGSIGFNLMSNMIDGDPATTFEIDDESARGTLSGFIELDLGAVIPGVTKIRFFPRPEHTDRFMRGFHLSINDGSNQTIDERGGLLWETVSRDEENTDSTIELDIPAQPVRYIRLQSRTTLPWEVAELEVFGGGFSRRGTYTSEIVELVNDEAGLANLGTLSWSARSTARASYEIRTRSGSTDDPYLYFRLDNVDGEEVPVPVSRQDYDRLPEDKRSSTEDIANWSGWSSIYKESAGPVLSPSPKRFFQFKIDLLSESFTDWAQVDSLAFTFSTPVMAHELLAQIQPRLATAGEQTTFTYTVGMSFEGDDRGFDALEVTTPLGVSSVRDFKIDGQTAVLDSFPRVLEDRVLLYFPRVTQGNNVLSFVFDARVLVFGTKFALRVFDRTAPDEIPQPADVDSEVSVNVVINNDLLSAVSVAPNPFTPNNDAINEETTISYQVLKILEPVPVRVKIYDLAGVLWRVFSRQEAFGIYEQIWDGTDQANRRVPPGNYIYRVEVDSETVTDTQVGIIGVAY